MILSNRYYNTYNVADFANNGKHTTYEDKYFCYNNALLAAKELATCQDIVGTVRTIDGLTGEVMYEFDNEGNWFHHDAEEKPCCSENNFTFVDRFGYTWKEQSKGLWSMDCQGISCRDCKYNTNAGNCKTDYLTLEEITNRIAEIDWK